MRDVWSLLQRVLVCFGLIVIAMIPGTRVRIRAPEVTAPPLVEVPTTRNARLDVFVMEAGTARTPVPRATIQVHYATDAGAVLVGRALTDESGKAAIEKLPAGALWIVADAEGRARGSTYVALTEGQPSSGVELALGPSHFLDVRVRGEKGEPVANAELEVSGAGPLPVSALTNAEGNAHVVGLGSGPWVVTARAAGLEEVTRSGVAEGTPFEVTLRKLGSVRVSVVEGDANTKVEGARVEITGAPIGTARVTKTDANGEVKIGGLPAGGYALRATKDARVSATELDVRIASGEERNVTLRLEPGISVAVRVLGEDARTEGEPIAQANVIVAESGLTPFPLEGVTDREGRARLGPIPRGPATVSVSARGYVSRGGLPAPANPNEEMRVLLPRAGVVEGRVVDARGFPIGGAMLVVIGTDRTGAPIDEDPRRASFRDALFSAALAGPATLLPRGELGVVPGPVPAIPRGAPTWVAPVAPAPSEPPSEPWTTRDDGTFRLTGVSPGRIRVLARHPQYVEATSDVVALEPAGRAEVNIVLRQGGVIEGVVVDARDRPERGARISALATRGLLDRSVRTGDDGRFAFASLPEQVTLLVEADGGRSARLTVDLKDGERRELRIMLSEPRDPVELRVRDDRDFPVDGVELSIGSLDPAVPLRATVFTDARGEARLNGARGLPLRIAASHPRHASKIVTLDAAGPTVAFVMTRGEAVFGEVRGRRQGALPGAEVVVSGEGTRARTSTNTRGEFRLEGLPPEKLRLVVRARGHAPLEKTITIEAKRSDRGADLGRIELEEECVVEGEVVGDDGKPVPGARVGQGRVPTWIPMGSLPPGLAVTDARGVFRLGELSEGTFVLEAYAPDFGRGHADGVRASPGRPTTGVRIVLAREGTSKSQAERAPGNVAITLGVTEDGALVITDVVEGSAADRAGLAEGDRIVEIDGAAVRSMEDARGRLAGPVRDDVIVAVRREGRALSVRVPREASRR